MNQNRQYPLAKLLTMQVAELEFPVSTMSALELHGIRTILDLVRTPEPACLAIVGRRRTKVIQDTLHQLGLTLGIDPS